jgi:2'-5' RNA ligase
MQPNRVRVFVALNVPETVRSSISAFIAKLRPACAEARWARLEGLHVTLKFIGEVPEEQIAAIEGSLAQVPFHNPIEINFRNVGFFPNQKRPLVFWAGIEAGPELPALAEAVNASLEPLGIAREQKTFSPHLTLARFKPARGTPKLDTLHIAIAAAAPLEFGSAIAKEFHLYQSILKPGGAEYTRLASFGAKTGDSQ